MMVAAAQQDSTGRFARNCWVRVCMYALLHCVLDFACSALLAQSPLAQSPLAQSPIQPSPSEANESVNLDSLSNRPIEFQLRQVFVPESDLSVLGDNFVPTDREKLVDLINEFRRSGDSGDQQRLPILSESIYVAKLVGQDLVSEYSRWTIDLNSSTAKTWNIPETSIAWRQITNLTSSKPFALNTTPPIQFRQDGGAECLLRDNVSNIGLAWSASGKSTDNTSQIRFNIQLPPAVQSRVLIELPPGWSIASLANIANSVSSIQKEIPPDWPDVVAREYNTGNWWLIQVPISGKLLFSIEKETERLSVKFSDVIARQHIDYHLTAQGLDVTSTTEIEGNPRKISDTNSQIDRPSFTLSIDPRLGIRDVLIDNRSTTWKSGDSENTIIVENLDPLSENIGRPIQVVVNALSEWPQSDEDIRLPSIDWQGFFVVDGSCSVRLSKDWQATSFLSSSGKPLGSYDSSSIKKLNRLDLEWHETLPIIYLNAKPNPTQLALDVFTRLTNSNDGFTALTRTTLPASSSKQRTVYLELENGWTIDSIQTLESSVATTVLKSTKEKVDGVTEKTLYEIGVSALTNQASIDLEIISKRAKSIEISKASQNNPSNDNSLYFSSCQPVRFLDYQQSDIYIIESTGRYTIDASPNLIECRIPEDQMSPRYRSTLPRIGDFWLIKPDMGRLPNIVFRRQAAPYTSEIETSIRPFGTKIETRYNVRCKPVAGAVSNITLSFPNGNSSNLKWRIRSESPSMPGSWLPIEVDSIENKRPTEKKTLKDDDQSILVAGPQRFRLSLPRPMSVPFEIEAIRQTESNKSIDLPTTPEATQIRARVDVESSLAIVDSDQEKADSHFQPQGNRYNETNVRFYRYQYIPSQISRIEVQKSNRVESCWIDTLHTMQYIYPRGARAAEVRLDLFCNGAPDLKVTLNPGWTIRSASLDGIQPLAVSNSESTEEQWSIILPNNHTSKPDNLCMSLIVILDGPAISLNDLEEIGWPNFTADCPLAKKSFSIKLPDGFSVEESSPRKVSLSDWLHAPADLLPSDWAIRFSFYNWFHRTFIPQKLSDVDSAIAVTNTEGVRIRSSVRQNNVQLFAIVSIFFLSFFIGNYSLKYFGIVIGTLLIATPLAKDFAIEWIYSANVALGFALMLLVTKRIAKEVQANRSNLVLQSSRLKSRIVQALFPVIISLTIAPNSPLIAETTSDSNTDGNQSSAPLYSVVFPIDENGKLSGDVAYVGESLLKLLNRRSSSPGNSNYLLSAKHELVIDSSLEETFRNPTCKVICKYEWNVQDTNRSIVIPLPSDYQSQLNFKVNGTEQNLGIRLQEKEANFVWQPQAKGKAELEVSFRCGLNIDIRNQLSLRLPIVPVANTVVEIFGQSIVDLQIDAAGQITNPSIGRYSISLGKRREITLKWKQSLARSNVKSIKADLDIEWAILQTQSIAKCKVFIEGESFDASKLEIECEQPWEPIGFDWGDGKVVEIVSGSTNLKRRFRVQWKDDMGLNTRQLEIFLRRSESNNQAIIGPPLLEIGGARIESRTITIAQRVQGDYAINRSSSWTPLPPKAKLFWLNTPFQEIQAFRTSDTSATISLSRNANPKQLEASVSGSLLFRSNSALGVTEFQFSNTNAPPTELLFTSPPGTSIQSVHFGEEEVPMIASMSSGSQNMIKVFTDGNFAKTRSARITFRHLYPRDLNWHAFPMVSLSNVKATSYKVSVNALIDLPIEFEGSNDRVMDKKNGNVHDNSGDSNRSVSSIKQFSQILTADLPFTLFQRAKKQLSEGNTNSEEQTLHPYLWTIDLSNLDSQPINLSDAKTSNQQVRYRMLSSLPEMQGHIISTMSLQGSEWKYSLTGSISQKTREVDGLLFDVPSSVAESMNSSHRLIKFESSEAGRRLVFVSNDKKLSTNDTSSAGNDFTFVIDCQLELLQSSTGISLPHVRLLNGPAVEHWLVVPHSTANQTLTWTTSGVRQFRPSPLPSIQPELQSNDLLWFQPVSSLPEVRLNVLQNRTKSASQLNVFHRLSEHSIDKAKLESYFLVDPNGSSHLLLRSPVHSTLHAIYVNGEACSIEESSLREDSRSSQSKIDLPLQSSVLPQFIKTIFLVPLDVAMNGEKNGHIDLPILESLALNNLFVEIDRSLSMPEIQRPSTPWKLVPSSEYREKFIEAMISCSDRLGDVAIDNSPQQKALWWNAWQSFSADQIFSGTQLFDTKSVEEWITARDRLVMKWKLDEVFDRKWIRNKLPAVDQPPSVNSTLLYQAEAPAKAPPSVSIVSKGDGVQTDPHSFPIGRQLLSPPPPLQSALSYIFAGVLLIMASLSKWIQRILSQAGNRIYATILLCPWRLFSMVGIVATVVFPLTWSGPLLLLLSFFLVSKQFILQGKFATTKFVS